MFNWPRTIRSGDTITLTGRHLTPERKHFWREFAIMFGLACMAAPLLICLYSYYVRGNQHAFGGEAWAFIIFGGFLSMIPGFIIGLILQPFFYYFIVRRRTTVTISPDTVRVYGIRYNREASPVRFTNLFPAAMGMHDGGGGRAVAATLEETNGLRMFYGLNAILIANFMTPADASRFALACNAVLGEVKTPAARRFESVTVSDLYEGDYAEALPGNSKRVLSSSARSLAALPAPRQAISTSSRFQRKVIGLGIVALILLAYFHTQVFQAISQFRHPRRPMPPYIPAHMQIPITPPLKLVP